MNEGLRQRWCDLLLAERERRRGPEEEARSAEAGERLFGELQQIGERMLAVCVPGRTLEDDLELASQLARAASWEQVNELRIPLDIAPIEAVALAMTVDLEAGLRLLSDYPSSQ